MVLQTSKILTLAMRRNSQADPTQSPENDSKVCVEWLTVGPPSWVVAGAGHPMPLIWHWWKKTIGAGHVGTPGSSNFPGSGFLNTGYRVCNRGPHTTWQLPCTNPHGTSSPLRQMFSLMRQSPEMPYLSVCLSVNLFVSVASACTFLLPL